MHSEDILIQHTAWRRGDTDARTTTELGYTATDLTRALDDAIDAIQKCHQLRADLEKERERANSILERERERVEQFRELLLQTQNVMIKEGFHYKHEAVQRITVARDEY